MKEYLTGICVFIVYFLFVGIGITAGYPEEFNSNTKDIVRVDSSFHRVEKNHRDKQINNSGNQNIETSNDKLDEAKVKVKAKGVYLTGYTAGSTEKLQNFIRLLDKTELNALVIDIKDVTGYLTYESKVPLARKIGAISKKITNISDLVNKLKEKNIYLIARIVVFKDPLLASKYPEHAVLKKGGGLWKDYKGVYWLNPYDKFNWKYIVEIAKEAAKIGFNEIQFDYVRFPSDGPVKQAVYKYKNDTTKVDAITSFLKFAKKNLENENVWISADVFGLTCSAKDDMGIGQKIEKIAEVVDYICPMVYPSHYASGTYGFKNPNAKPYETVYNSLQDAIKKLENLEKNRAKIRPWLQDFTYKKPAYSYQEVTEQIQAVIDSGIDEWLLWNAKNKYSVKALKLNDNN